MNKDAKTAVKSASSAGNDDMIHLSLGVVGMISIRIGCSFLLFVALAGCASADVGDRERRAVENTRARAAAQRHAVPLLTERPVTPVAPAPTPRIVPPTMTAPVSPAPVPVTSCDPGGCWGSGNRYNGGAGGTYLDRSGRMCQGNGTWMQCY